jgi:hypothetical protein
MQHHRTLLPSIVVVVMLVLALAAPATTLAALAAELGAGRPTLAQATGFVPFSGHTQTLLRTAGLSDNSTYTAVDKVTFTGGISGHPVDTYTFTVHPDGSTTGQGIETCTDCTIGGRTGGYTEVFSFTATPNFVTFQGPFTILSSTGGLAGLRAEGTFQGGATSTGFTETISLNYHFEP